MPDDVATCRQQRRSPVFQRVAPVILFVINFILQLPTVVIGCFNSEPKLLYSSIILGLSFLSVLPWIIELVLRWTRRVPLLSPSPTGNKPFFSFADIVGLPSAVCQSIFTTINLVLLVRHSNTQIKISVLAILFALVQLLSTFYAGTDQTKSGQTDYAPLNSMSSDIDLPRYKYPKSPTVTQDFKQTCWRCFRCCSQITIEQRFAIINFINELPAIVLDQVSFEPKSLHAMILMLLSIVALLLYFIELTYKTRCCKRSNKGPRMSPNKASFILEFAGLLSAVLQPIFTAVNYVLVHRHRGELPISVLPIVFTLGLACYKFQDSCPNKIKREGNIDEETEISVMNGHLSVITPPQPSLGVNRIMKSMVNEDYQVPMETESEGRAVQDDEIDLGVAMTPTVNGDNQVPLETESEGSVVQDGLENAALLEKTWAIETDRIAQAVNSLDELGETLGELKKKTMAYVKKSSAIEGTYCLSAAESWPIEPPFCLSVKGKQQYLELKVKQHIGEEEIERLFLPSRARFPDSNSNNTTPKLYTLLFIGGIRPAKFSPIRASHYPLKKDGVTLAAKEHLHALEKMEMSLDEIKKTLDAVAGENELKKLRKADGGIVLEEKSLDDKLKKTWDAVERKIALEKEALVGNKDRNNSLKKSLDEVVKTWVIQKKRESASLKEKELMKEPTRRNAEHGLRRRVRNGR